MGIPLAILLFVACPPKHAQDDLVYQLDREVIALKERNAWLEEHQGDCGTAVRPSPIYAELVQVLPPGEALVTRDGGTTLVSIQVSSLFSSGSLAVRRESTMVLDLLATALNLHPEQPVQIVGYADDSPVGSSLRRYYPSNWELSAVRAGAVASELIHKYQVDPARLMIASRGPMEPVADNDTPEGRDANRRIVVRILPPPASGADAISWQ
ncbi:MAG: OmpA family protein [Pseudomonadota bacterium]